MRAYLAGAVLRKRTQGYTHARKRCAHAHTLRALTLRLSYFVGAGSQLCWLHNAYDSDSALTTFVNGEQFISRRA